MKWRSEKQEMGKTTILISYGSEILLIDYYQHIEIGFDFINNLKQS